MKKLSRTTIQIETHEVTVIRFGATQTTAFCDCCGEEVPVVDQEQAAKVIDLPPAAVFQLIEEKRIHLVGGGRLICGRSLTS